MLHMLKNYLTLCPNNSANIMITITTSNSQFHLNMYNNNSTSKSEARANGNKTRYWTFPANRFILFSTYSQTHIKKKIIKHRVLLHILQPICFSYQTNKIKDKVTHTHKSYALKSSSSFISFFETKKHNFF